MLAEQVGTRGVSAVIFPEGTRARHGELGTFRRRGTLALLEAAPDTAAAIGRWRQGPGDHPE